MSQYQSMPGDHKNVSDIQPARPFANQCHALSAILINSQSEPLTGSINKKGFARDMDMKVLP